MLGGGGTRPSLPGSHGQTLLPQQKWCLCMCETCYSLSLQDKGSFPSPPCLHSSTLSDYGRGRSALSSQPLRSLGRNVDRQRRKERPAHHLPPFPTTPGLRGKTGHEHFLDTDMEMHKPLLVRAPSTKGL